MIKDYHTYGERWTCNIRYITVKYNLIKEVFHDFFLKINTICIHHKTYCRLHNQNMQMVMQKYDYTSEASWMHNLVCRKSTKCFKRRHVLIILIFRLILISWGGRIREIKNKKLWPKGVKITTVLKAEYFSKFWHTDMLKARMNIKSLIL